jgi:hypothetical protein
MLSVRLDVPDQRVWTRFTAVVLCCAVLAAAAPAARGATVAQAFNRVRHARFHRTPLWPAYLPAKIANATWFVETIRGKGPYGHTPLSAPNGYEVYYSYHLMGGYGGGGFARTNEDGLNRLLRVAYIDREWPRYIHLGGRSVIKFRPGTTGTDWAFSGPGGIYVFRSNDFGGASQRTIGRMIRSMRPVTQLAPP